MDFTDEWDQMDSETELQSLAADLRDERIRDRALQRLVHLGPPATEVLFGALTERTSPDLRVAAAEALGKIRDERAVDALARALEDPDMYVRWAAAEALSRLGPAAVAPLSSALQDHRLCNVAASALCEIGGPDAVKALCAALQHRLPLDGHSRMHSAATAALAKLAESGVIPEMRLALPALDRLSWGYDTFARLAQTIRTATRRSQELPLPAPPPASRGADLPIATET